MEKLINNPINTRGHSMFIKRNKIILAVFTLSIILLFSRVIYIQFILGEKLFIQATAQKVSELTVDVPRGNILDRNLIPLTNRKRKWMW